MSNKKKIAKLDKSEAAKLKETLEKRQLGDTSEPTTVTISSGDKSVTMTSSDLKDAAASPDKASKKLRKLVKEAVARKIKPEQTDMVKEGKLFVPEPTSPLYLAGKRLADCIDKEETIKNDKAEAITEVLKCMKKAKRLMYRFCGFTFEFHHQGASDKLKVIKPN